MRSLDYRIPALWDCWGYQGRRQRARGEVLVQPREYVTACLEWIYRQSEFEGPYVGRSLSQIRRNTRRSSHRAPGNLSARADDTRPAAGCGGGDWIARQILYGMMVRTTTAWDHDGDGRVTSRRYAEMGTFLKSVLLLPLLNKMGITTVSTLR